MWPRCPGASAFSALTSADSRCGDASCSVRIHLGQRLRGQLLHGCQRPQRTPTLPGSRSSTTCTPAAILPRADTSGCLSVRGGCRHVGEGLAGERRHRHEGRSLGSLERGLDLRHRFDLGFGGDLLGCAPYCGAGHPPGQTDLGSATRGSFVPLLSQGRQHQGQAGGGAEHRGGRLEAQGQLRAPRTPD